MVKETHKRPAGVNQSWKVTLPPHANQRPVLFSLYGQTFTLNISFHTVSLQCVKIEVSGVGALSSFHQDSMN